MDRLRKFLCSITVSAIILAFLIIALIYFSLQDRSASIERNSQRISDLTSVVSKQQDIIEQQQYLIQETNKKLDTITNVKPQNGKDGKDGAQGMPGQSIKGDKGDDGHNGLSAYELALTQGFQGTLQEYLDSLKGDDGVNGRNIQQRCNKNKLQVEWRLEGDTNWKPLYKVQECA